MKPDPEVGGWPMAQIESLHVALQAEIKHDQKLLAEKQGRADRLRKEITRRKRGTK